MASRQLQILREMASSSTNNEGREEEMDPSGGEMTPLQKHASFFDRNKDGIIYPWETFQGLRAIGCGVVLSSAGALLFNGSLAPKTRLGKFTAPSLPIYLKHISKGKRGSDSGVYDTEGRFDPEKFEEIFKQHVHTNPNGLTSKELDDILKANLVPKDFSSWIINFTEWKLLYSLCKDKDGLLHKDTVRAVYDGSLFVKLEEERKSNQKKV